MLTFDFASTNSDQNHNEGKPVSSLCMDTFDNLLPQPPKLL